MGSIVARLLGRPLRLYVGGKELGFPSLAEFEFALAGRTEVSMERLRSLLEASVEELQAEATQIKAVESRLVAVLTRCMDYPETIAENFRYIPENLLSQDYEWRAIFVSLLDVDKSYDPLRRAALVKYMQYLTSRQDAIRAIHRLKRRAEADQVPRAEDFSPADVERLARETMMFMADGKVQNSGPDFTEMVRIPKGELIHIPLQQKGSVPILLSTHPFRLLMDGEVLWQDETDHGTFPLRQGNNLIGRTEDCQVLVNPSFRDISRKHVLVEVGGDRSVRMVDLSAHGTYVPSRLLKLNTKA
jgi:hypothetical protein